MAAEVIGAILTSADFFARLGLPRQKIAPADVRKAYRRRALQCHPDKTDHPRANEAFQQLSEAFECLHDEKAQAAYLLVAIRQQQKQQQQRDHKRRRSDDGGGSKKRRSGGSTAGATWYQRARSWADIERELARREKIERAIRAQFVASQSSKFSCREAERLLLRAQKICRTLDERKSDGDGDKKINPLWATLVEQEAAASAMLDDLPEGWEARRSHHGTLYYFHARTGQSSSEHPVRAHEHFVCCSDKSSNLAASADQAISIYRTQRSVSTGCDLNQNHLLVQAAHLVMLPAEQRQGSS